MTDLCKCDWKEKIQAMWERLQTTIYGVRLNGTRLNPDGQGVIDINTENLIELDNQVRSNDLPVKNRAIKQYVDAGDSDNATAITNLSNDTTAALNQLRNTLSAQIVAGDSENATAITNLGNNTNTRITNLDTSLSSAIASGDATNATAITSVNTTLGGRIDALSASTAGDISDLNDRVDDLEEATGDAITSSDISTTASTVTITHKHLDEAVDTDSMPVASITQAGVINATDYQAFVQMQEDVNDLKGTAITYSIALNTPTPTQEQITQAFTSTYPSVSLIAGIKVADYIQNLAYQYDGTVWVSQQFSGSIPIASSTVLGGVKSSNTDGEIAVNISGTMSLNGYDFIIDRLDDIDGTGGSIEQLESEIDALQTNVTDHGTRLNTAENNIQMLDSDIAEIDGDIINLTTSVNQNTTAISGLQTSKQNALDSGQLSAVNSGITSDKVSTYDGYATLISGKQATLDSAQLSAVNSGIDSTKVGQIATNQTNITTLDGQVSAINTAVSGLQVTVAGKVNTSNITHETWTFTLENNTTVNKEVVLYVS